MSLAVVGLSSALVQGGLTGRIVKKIGEQRAVTFGLGISAFSNVLYGLANRGWMMYAIPFVASLGFIAGPSSQSIIAKSVKPNEQGATQGALTSILSLTGVIGPIVGTSVFSYFISAKAPFALPGASFFLGAFLYLIAMVVASWLFARVTVPDGHMVAEALAEEAVPLPH